jgi:hypothetical protein
MSTGTPEEADEKGRTRPPASTAWARRLRLAATPTPPSLSHSRTHNMLSRRQGLGAGMGSNQELLMPPIKGRTKRGEMKAHDGTRRKDEACSSLLMRNTLPQPFIPSLRPSPPRPPRHSVLANRGIWPSKWSETAKEAFLSGVRCRRGPTSQPTPHFPLCQGLGGFSLTMVCLFANQKQFLGSYIAQGKNKGIVMCQKWQRINWFGLVCSDIVKPKDRWLRWLVGDW